MTDRRKSGWLSSVVGNLSGFWSRSPEQNEQKTSRTFTEVQADGDFETNDRFEDAVSKFSPDSPTTSANGVNVRLRPTRYLSPTLLMDSMKQPQSGTSATRSSVSRKRAFEELVVESGRKSLSNGKLPNLDSSLDLSFPSGNSSKRYRTSNRFLNETAPQLEKSLLDGSIDPLNKLSTFEFSNTSKLLQPRISRPSSAVSSSLSSKTRAILLQLEKISTPAKEVKKLPFVCRSERWSTDCRSPVSRALSHASSRPLSRAQVISNTMSASLPSKPYWRRPEKVVGSSASFKKDDLPLFEKKESSLNSILRVNSSEEKEKSDFEGALATTRKKCEPILKGVDGKPANKGSKVFSAKNLDLEIDGETNADVRPLDESLFTAKGLAPATVAPAPGFLGVASTVVGVSSATSSKDSCKSQMSESLGDDLFSFARPKKRGPLKQDEETESSTDVSEDESGDTEEVSDDEDTEKTGVESKKIASASCEDNSTTKKVVETSEVDSRESTAKTQARVLEGFSERQRGAAFEASEKDQTTTAKQVSKGSKVTIPVTVSESESSKKPEKSVASASNKWTCSMCWVPNEKAVSKCVCCGTQNPLDKPAEKTFTPVVANSAASGVAAKAWSCPDCLVQNKADVYKCVCCGHEKAGDKEKFSGTLKSAQESLSKQASALPEKSAVNIFGDRAFKPQLVSKTDLSFGFGLKSTPDSTSSSETVPKTTLSSSSSAVSFETTPVPSVSEPSASLPKFGLNGSSSTPNFGLLFGKPTEASTSTAVTETKVNSSVAPSYEIGVLPGVETSKASQEATGGASKSLFAFKNTIFGGLNEGTASDGLSFGAAKKTDSPAFPAVFGSSSGILNKPVNGVSNTNESKPAMNFGATNTIFSSTAAGTSTATSQKENSASSVEMSSPSSSGVNVLSQTTASSAFTFSVTPSFNFVSNTTAPSVTASGLFAPVNNKTSAATPSFTFGSVVTEANKSLNDTVVSQSAPSLTKVFSAPSTLPAPPTTFNFGSTPAAANLFSGIPQAPSFNFGATAENVFSASAASFGSTNVQPNPFDSGTTSLVQPRKMLKARRLRR